MTTTGGPKDGERIEGPTPNGGAYAILYRREGTDPQEIEIVEFDANGEAISRTYGTISPRPGDPPADPK